MLSFGASVATTQTIAESIATRVRKLDGVANTVVTIGDDPQQTLNLASIYVKLGEASKRENQYEIMDRVRKEVLPLYQRLNLRTSVAPVNEFGGGQKATSYYEGGEEYEVHVRAEESSRNDVGAISQIEVPSARGTNVKLDDLVTLKEGTGPSVIEAEAEASMPSAGNDAVGNSASETQGKVGGVCPAVAVHSAVVSEPDTTEREAASEALGRVDPPRLRSRSAPLEDQPRIVSEHGKPCERLGISHAVESNSKCFFLSSRSVPLPLVAGRSPAFAYFPRVFRN